MTPVSQHALALHSSQVTGVLALGDMRQIQTFAGVLGTGRAVVADLL